MKKQLLELKGIITVLNTPFTDRNALDLPSLRKNVRYALEAGVAGFLVPAMASEVDKLSSEERRQIVEAVLAENSGHYIQFDEPQLVVESIREIVELHRR